MPNRIGKGSDACSEARSVRRMPPVAKEFEHHQPGADHDRGISQIECVPVVAAPM